MNVIEQDQEFPYMNMTEQDQEFPYVIFAFCATVAYFYILYNCMHTGFSINSASTSAISNEV